MYIYIHISFHKGSFLFFGGGIGVHFYYFWGHMQAYKVFVLSQREQRFIFPNGFGVGDRHLHTSAYVSIRQHTWAYVRIRQTTRTALNFPERL